MSKHKLRCLVLTPWMQPHRIAPWQSAVTLVVLGKADVLETYEATCSSPSVTVQIPAVLRLVKEMHANKRGVKFSRHNVYARDRYTCCYDGRQYPMKELNYDHVLPRCRGGKTDWENIVTSCIRCNLRKGNKTPAQAGMHMHFQPFKPRVLPLTAPFLVDPDNVPELWKPYIPAAMAQCA